MASNLDPAQVPEPLRYLIPLAERWGIGDDFERVAAVKAASDAERAALVAAVDDAPEGLWNWLVGPESFGTPSQEYVAMTDLTQAADLARLLLNRSDGF